MTLRRGAACALVLGLASALLTGCSPSITSATVTITPPDFPVVMDGVPSSGPSIHGDALQLQVGARAVLDCGTVNPSAGTDWQVAPGYDTTMVNVTVSRRYESNAPGSDAQLIFAVNALAPGKTDVTFTYDWRLQTASIGSYTVTVEVTQ